jgi:branched-chain amino acid transport system ATP-binding protein
VSGPAVLEMNRVDASYGPFKALFDVSLTVGAGEAVGVLGPNGAGKTTIARVASGLVEPSAGTVSIDGTDFTGKRPFLFARSGVAHAPEGRSVLGTLTVQENLTLSFNQSLGRSGVDDGLEQAFDLFPRLGERRNQIAGTLSGGEQRMLSLSRVLVESPRLLIADELSLGLAPIVISQVYDTLERVRESGTSLLIIEQFVGHAVSLCDRIVVLDHGAVGWEGASSEAAEIVTSGVFGTETV